MIGSSSTSDPVPASAICPSEDCCSHGHPCGPQCSGDREAVI